MSKRDDRYDKDLQYVVSKIGDDIRERRVAKGLSQTQLAAIVGTRQPVISRIEKGTHVPTWYNLQRIARALNTNVIVKFNDK